MKLFFLFLLIMLVIGIGVFVLTQEQESLPEFQYTRAPDNEDASLEFFEPSEAMTQTIIRSVLIPKFNASTATHAIMNLDGKAGPELVIGAVERTADSSALPNTGIIQVVSILNHEGEYKRVGKIEYHEMLRGVPTLKSSRDITGDGSRELIMSLMYGGASSVAEGIVHVDFANNELTWAQLRDMQGSEQDAIFILSATFGRRNYFEIQDINGDGREEITEIFARTLPGDSGLPCDAAVYEWDGDTFVYSEDFSQQVLSRLDSECAL